LGLVWGLGGFGGFDTFFFSLYKALRFLNYFIIPFLFHIICILSGNIIKATA
jgi:hypothetical protein